jgi:predicted enzyme related to lactoylglutathione lyase
MKNRKGLAGLTVATITLALGLVAAQARQENKAAQETAAPKPGPEMEKLSFLLGKWDVVSKYEETPLFPRGGEAKGVYAAKAGPGGFSVVADFEAAGGPEGAIQGHEVITWDAREKAYKQYTFGNNFPGAFLATGQWEEHKLVFHGDLEFGGAKLHFRNELTRDAAGAVTMKESYRTGDAPMALMITTKAVRPRRPSERETRQNGGKDERAQAEASATGGRMGRAVVHFEIGCRDIEKTQDFYKKLFDWKITAAGPAAMIAAETGGIDGHITSLGHEPHHYTMFYVDVDDVGAYLKKAEGLGGKTLVPPVAIPTGTFAWFMDPEGNTVGLWKAK